MATNDEILNQYKEQWVTANSKGDKAGMEAAHIGAEAHRATQGYSGGADGSQYIPYASVQSAPNSATAMSTQDQYLAGIYAQQEAKAKAELDAAYQKNVNALNATAAKIPETYNTARNQTAATSEQNRAAFNEQAAASGINSGAGSQANLAIGNTITSNLGALNKQETAAITDINNQRTQLETDYNNAIAQAVAQNNIAKAQALYQEKVRQDNLLLEQQQYQTQLDMQNRQYSDTLASNNAQALASIGNFSGFKAAPYNWTDAQVAQAEALFKQKNAPKAYGGSGYTGTPKEDPIVGLFGVSNGITDTSTQGAFGGTTTSDIASAKEQINQEIANGKTLSQIGGQLYTAYQNNQLDNKTFGTYMAAIQIAQTESKGK